MVQRRDPLEVTRNEDTGVYAISFFPDDVELLASAIAKGGHSVTGYSVEAVLTQLSEIGSPDWADELDFDSEADSFCVRSRRRLPLVRLVQRLRRRLDDPKAMRRLVSAVPGSMFVGDD